MFSIKKLVYIFLALFLFACTAVSTLFLTSESSSTNSDEKVNQLNAQISNLKIELENVQKESEDIKAIRAMMEKEQAAKEAGQKRHEKSLSTTQPMFRGFENFEFEPAGVQKKTQE